MRIFEFARSFWTFFERQRSELVCAKALAAILILWSVALFCPRASGAVTRIDTNAVVATPTSAEWLFVVNFRPGDGEVIQLNPPRFTWSYVPDPKNSDADTEAKKFRFVIGYDSNFTSVAIDLIVQQNMYNLLGPLSNNVCFWKIGYIHDGATEPYTWSKTRKFVIADTATTWDRSMLTNETYLASRAAHPHILFNASNRGGLLDFLNLRESQLATSPITELDTGKGWKILKAAAKQAITNTWWPDSQPTNTSPGGWAQAIATVAFVKQVSQDPAYANSNPQNALVQLARWYMATNGPRTDNISYSYLTPAYRTLAVGYDWLYDAMTPDQRTEVLNALEARCRFMVMGEMWWYDGKDPYWFGRGDPSGQYKTGVWLQRSSTAKIGGTHGDDNFHWTVIGALAGYGEGPACRDLLNFFLNYGIGKTFFGGDYGPSLGRPYTYNTLFETQALYQNMLASLIFPEAQLNLNPFWNEAADYWSKMLPVGFVQAHEPWGDTGWGPLNFWQNNDMGRNLALFTGNGEAYQHWIEQVRIKPSDHMYDDWVFLPLPFLFPPPQPKNSTTLTHVSLADGWAVSESAPSNTRECFTNGVGFIFQARPRGSEGGHSHFSDLSFQIWAYNSVITDAGAGMTAYSKVPMAHYSLLVNGLGTAQPVNTPVKPIYSRIIASQEGPDFMYVAADATEAYPKTDFIPAGWLAPADFFNRHKGAPLADLKKVQRHILFVRKKYFVMYDELQRDTASKFSWLYHIYDDSLQLDTNNASFLYTANSVKASRLRPTDPFPADVPVMVKHIVSPTSLEFLDLSTNKVRSNPFTGEDYWTQGDQFPRAHAVWVSNKGLTKHFHFMTVIYPIKPGAPAPTINRLDDYTAEIINGDEHDVISFDGRTTLPATLVVNPYAINGEKPPVRSPGNFRVVPPPNP